MICKLVNKVLASIRWLWLIPITTFLATYFANIAPTPWKDFAKGFPVSVIGWYFLGPYRIYTYIAFGLLIALPLVAWLLKSKLQCNEADEGIGEGNKAIVQYNKGDTAIFQNSAVNPIFIQRSRDTTVIVHPIPHGDSLENRKSNNDRYNDRYKEITKYLNLVIAAHESLYLSGIYQLPADVNVPLDEVFIHLNAISDRPIYEVPREQTALLEELYQRTDLNDDEREELIHRLHIIWHSQHEQVGRSKDIALEKVLQGLQSYQPVAILLGDPGSGKSTSLRWLALNMARAIRSSNYSLPDALAPAQIPILLRISDYAKYLSSAKNPSFHDFFTQQLMDTYPSIPNLVDILLYELKIGHCLLLIDGLDEVANNRLRRQIVDSVQQFITSYSIDYITDETGSFFNRYIITSRIVGYEAGAFARYAHYTLLDLKDEQITKFLKTWCRAVERYRTMSARGMLKLTTQEEVYVNKSADVHSEQLLNALESNPSIKRLAVNPLMLTILALIQHSGRTLPNRRIELYQTITLTLLHNWNIDTGRQVLQPDDIPLAEQLFSNLAYRLHSSDPLLSEGEVKEIAFNAMKEFYEYAPSQSDIQQFITVLRSSSGLFVESGLGLFNFMHRTFQEYYVARYLLRLPAEELERFFIEHYSNPIWHEPLLLVAAYKSGQDSHYERDQVNKLIRALLDTENIYDKVLQRNTLFAANCLVDCSIWSINRNLQHDIANRLFDLYGNAIENGRYRELQQEIERLSLLWLRGQPKESSHRNAVPPLLDAWRAALCDENTPVRQEGAVSLLAAIAPDLSTCPKVVMSTLLPPLLQLAKLKDLPYSEEFIAQSTEVIARPASNIIEEYANVTLCLLETAGPAGWLHSIWLKWIGKQTKLAVDLTNHALEINFLLTPAALPIKSERTWDSTQWRTQFNLSEDWSKIGKHNPLDLQMQLMHASDTARFPQAYLFKQMLDRESNALSEANVDWHWRLVWEDFLQREMENGHNATYFTCLNIRLLLCHGNSPLLQKIVSEFLTALQANNTQEEQAIIAVSIIYSLNVKYLRTTLEIQDFNYPHEIDYGQYIRCLQYIGRRLDIRNLRNDIRGIPYGTNPRLIPCLFHLPLIQYLRGLRYLLEMRDMCDTYYIRNLLDQDLVVERLCNNLKLKQTEDPLLSSLLFSLYCVLAAYETIPATIKQLIKESFRIFAQGAQSPILVNHLLIRAILQQVDNAGSPSITPASSSTLYPLVTLPTIIYTLKEHTCPQINKRQIEEILAACTDETPLSSELMRQVGYRYKSVQDLMWSLLGEQFNLELEAQQEVLNALNHDDARICGAATLMLQRKRAFSHNVQIEAARKIMDLMQTEKLAPRPLKMANDVVRLDEVLFATLKVLAEV